MDYIKDLHDMCEVISEEIADANRKIQQGGGKLSAGDIDYIDKLTHALKSIKTTIAMMESEDGYSGRYMPVYGGGMTYNRRNSNRGRSYRGSYAQRRDSMGRYSREDGYSYDDGIAEIVEEMRGMMDTLPEEKRREVEKFVNRMDRM